MISRRMALGAGIATVATACTQSEKAGSDAMAMAEAMDKTDCCCQPGRQVFIMNGQIADLRFRNLADIGRGLEIVGEGSDLSLPDGYRSFEDLAAVTGQLRKLGADGRVKGLSGPGGLVGLSFVEVADELIRRKTFVGSPKTAGTLCVSGLIDCDDGYRYDEATKSGHINSTTYVEVTFPDGSTFEYAMRWKVDVMDNGNGGFKVTPKDLTNPSDVFPDKDNPVKITARQGGCFNYKLWAIGTDIVIKSVEISTDGGATWTLVPSTDPLYVTDEKSCIDIMFEDYPPPSFPADKPRPFYCMGRCGQPFLVNTK